MAIIPGVENINFMPIIAQFVYWLGIGLVALLIIGCFGMGAYFLQFKLKANVYPLYGSGRDGIFSVGKKKVNRIKWINNRTAWKAWWPLFNRREREPFDSEYIYPGDEVNVFELNDEWIPGRIGVELLNKNGPLDENNIRAGISPVPYYVRNWQSLTHKKNAIEFAKQGFWEENKNLILGVITVGICCAVCGLTVYLTYKFATGGSNQMSALTEAIKNIGTIGGNSAIVPN